jgi:hypothetical protein
MKFREIPGSSIFDKLDGSSMRSEWSRKRGFFKHGRRSGLLDDSNPALLEVPDLFNELLAKTLDSLARGLGWEHLIVFYEFWGVKSLGGIHVADDPKFLTVFDAAVNKKGILGPSDFRRAFEGMVPTPKFLGTYNFTRGFADEVRRGGVEGITFEGVVAKAGSGHDIVRAKAKTQKWIDAIRAMHGAKAESIINS